MLWRWPVNIIPLDGSADPLLVREHVGLACGATVAHPTSVSH